MARPARLRIGARLRDGLVGLASAGRLAGRATVLAGDPKTRPVSGPLAWTDALRRRDDQIGIRQRLHVR